MWFEVLEFPVPDDEGASRPSFDVVRFPYLFFKYRAHELSAAPSLSPPAGNKKDLL